MSSLTNPGRACAWPINKSRVKPKVIKMDLRILNLASVALKQLMLSQRFSNAMFSWNYVTGDNPDGSSGSASPTVARCGFRSQFRNWFDATIITV
jgi:hypothetical protein